MCISVFCIVFMVFLCWCRLVLVKWNVCGLMLVRNVFSDVGRVLVLVFGGVGLFISIGYGFLFGVIIDNV